MAIFGELVCVYQKFLDIHAVSYKYFFYKKERVQKK
jgi:hypothetical protein